MCAIPNGAKVTEGSRTCHVSDAWLEAMIGPTVCVFTTLKRRCILLYLTLGASLFQVFQSATPDGGLDA